MIGAVRAGMVLDVLLARQAGVISREQALRAGLGAATVDRMVRTRRWRPLHPRVYRVPGYGTDDEARARVAVLWAGDGAVLSGTAAAWWHGLLADAPRVLGVTVPVRRPTRPGVAVQCRLLDVADRTEHRGLPVTALGLTALEAAARRSLGCPARPRTVEDRLARGTRRVRAQPDSHLCPVAGGGRAPCSQPSTGVISTTSKPGTGRSPGSRGEAVLTPAAVQAMPRATVKCEHSRIHPRGTRAAVRRPVSSDGRELRNVAIVAHVDHGKTTLVDAMLRAVGGVRRARRSRSTGSSTPATWSARRASRSSPSRPRSTGTGMTRSTSSTPPATPTSAARWSAPSRWSTASCCSSTRARARCRRPASCCARRSPPACRWCWSSTRPTGPTRAAPRWSTRASSCCSSSPTSWGSTRPRRAACSTSRSSTPPPAPAARAARARPTARRRPPRGSTRCSTSSPEPSRRRPTIRRPPLQAHVTNLDATRFLGRIALCRVRAGTLRRGQQVAWCRADGTVTRVKITELLRTEALERVPADSASAGDLVAVAGIADVTIGDTLADPERPGAAARASASTSRRSRSPSASTPRRWPAATRTPARSSPRGW